MEKEDCTTCRLISTGGLCGAGVYVGYHGAKLPPQKKVQKSLMAFAAFGLISVGFARLFNLPPFNKSSESDDLSRQSQSD